MLVDAELPLEGAELFDELGPEAVVLGLVTLGLAVAGRACTSQWKGWKLEFGSTQDGYFDA